MSLGVGAAGGFCVRRSGGGYSSANLGKSRLQVWGGEGERRKRIIISQRFSPMEKAEASLFVPLGPAVAHFTRWDL